MSPFIWRPPEEHLANSHVARFMRKHGITTYDELIKRSVTDIEWFWNAALHDIGIEWYRPYDRLLDKSGGFPWAKWFLGGTINIVHNCIDRHLATQGDDTAIIWEGDDGALRTLTYHALSADVCRLANALKRRGIRRGDAVGLYLPMIPEVVISMFACLKIGAVAVPIFSGFGPEALAVRLSDAEAKVLITADGGFRRGKIIPIKPNADAALQKAPSVQHMIVVQHSMKNPLSLHPLPHGGEGRGEGDPMPWKKGRDEWWHDALAAETSACPTEILEAEARALILYTSGTTGKPKGTVHTHAGCLAQMGKELRYAFDVRPHEPFFWFTDIGWMMGPWEMIGVSLFGGTSLIFEGAPDWPDPGRLWQMVERHRIVTLGISPTAIRMLIRSGEAWPKKYDLSSLRILGSTGEPWDPESYRWFFENAGDRRCPIINISGGTELVGCLLSPLPIMPLKACSLGGPGLGMDVDVFDDAGKSVRGAVGHLVCKQPAPSMTKGFLKDRERYLETYFAAFGEGVWYHGDWASVDADGQWFLHGRSDDTIKVAGKRTGPAEVEAALIAHPLVSEAAAIGVPHAIKGEGVVCFVVLKPGAAASDTLREELREQVIKALGKTLRPEEVKFVSSLPKTRSAKIVRSAIRKIYCGEVLGDIASIENPASLEAIRNAT